MRELNEQEQSGLSEQYSWWQWPFNFIRWYRHIYSKLNLRAAAVPLGLLDGVNGIPCLVTSTNSTANHKELTRRCTSVNGFWSVLSLYWSWQPVQKKINSPSFMKNKHAELSFGAAEQVFILAQRAGVPDFISDWL